MSQRPALALVTGASSGIGQTLCRFLAKKGINLLISGRDEDCLTQLQKELKPYVKVNVVVADLVDPIQRFNLISRIRQEGPDLVINNAGFGLYGGCLTYPTEDQLNILELNGKVLLEISLEAARALVSKKKQGVIVNVSSAAAFQILPGMAVYAAAKSFVNQFSQAFNLEMRPYGVSVLSICPGMVKTQFQERAGGTKKKQEFGLMSPEFVAEQIWEQIQSKKPVKIVDWKYRLLTYVSSLFPINWVAALVKKNILNRIPPRMIITNDESR